jgi:hypothetical protein
LRRFYTLQSTLTREGWPLATVKTEAIGTQSSVADPDSLNLDPAFEANQGLLRTKNLRRKKYG